MQSLDNNTKAFLALVRAGLWETDIQLLPFNDIDYTQVLKLAEEQSVVGLVAAGLEFVEDVKVPKDDILLFMGRALQIEQTNIAMNQYLSFLIARMRSVGIYALLVKGQGIAQCYERPLWRMSGDIDFLLNEKNYGNAKMFYDAVGSTKKQNKKNIERQHLEYNVGLWVVELHGTLHTNITKRIDREIDLVQESVFQRGDVRVWRNNDTDVFIPSPNNDIIFVFTHILQHFFEGGIGLRQLCDLSRLLWKYSSEIDRDLLKQRLQKMRLMTEWKSFGFLMVNTLGTPVDVFPFYDPKYQRKSGLILSYILETGNFGHNKDYSYYDKYPVITRKIITFWRQIKDSLNLAKVFPVDSLKFMFGFFIRGVKEI